MAAAAARAKKTVVDLDEEMVKKGKKKGKILGIKFKEEDEGVLF